MSAAEELQSQAPASSLSMLRALGGIAMISGFLVVLVYQWTLPIIEENQRIAIERAIFQVVPGAVTRRDFVIGEEGIAAGERSAEVSGQKVYAAYDGEGALQGIALQAAAQGYQDTIKLLYGYNPECQCITGIKILKMTETPGLGDKIAFDPGFLENFVALDAQLNAAGDGLANQIVAVKHGAKTKAWQIDAISGATVSSVAVAKALDNSARQMAPLIMKHIDVLQAPSDQSGSGD